MTHLGERRTLLLRNATYLDMLNTGNLRLIHDTKLRDRVTGFYQDTQFKFEIINKNNTALVDETYRQRIIASGLVMPRISSNLASNAMRNAEARRMLGDAIRSPADRLWALPPDAPEWAIVRGNLLARVNVASTSSFLLVQCIEDALALKAEVDAALAR